MSQEVAEKLAKLEQEIKAEAANYQAIEVSLRDASAALYKSVKEYQRLREHGQRDIWKEEKKGWCCGCEKFHPSNSLQLLATSARQWPEIKTSPTQWRISFYCRHCANVKLTSYRGGEENWQCFRARKTKQGFDLYISGEWQALDMNAQPPPEVKLERTGYISESEYQIGKNIIFQGYPAKLFIDEGEVVKVLL
jgi:hypothetical protein